MVIKPALVALLVHLPKMDRQRVDMRDSETVHLHPSYRVVQNITGHCTLRVKKRATAMLP